MEKKRFVFDMDSTLLTFDKDYHEEFLSNEFGENSDFSKNSREYMETYWTNYPYFVDSRVTNNIKLLSGIPIKDDFVKRWREYLTEMPIMLEEGVGDTLEYLKSKDKSLAVLTNWYESCQKEKLKRAGILSYFDEVYTGDTVLKPQRRAYDIASGHYDKDAVLFVGDDLENDYLAPREYGYDSILYDCRDKYPKSLVKVKRIDELKERY